MGVHTLRGAPCTFVHPLDVRTPHMFPMLHCASVCSRGYLHVMWGYMEMGHPIWLYNLDAPLYVQMAPHMSGAHPTHLHTPMLPCISICSRWYLHVIWRIHPTYWGLGTSALLSGILVSVSTSIVLSLWVAASWTHYLDVCYASCYSFLVVHYVSSLYYYSYDYYAPGDCTVLWYVISLISYHCSLFDGASCNIGSVWCGSATTPDTKMPWKCYWPFLCATVVTSIFDASSGLCQLCHQFSTGRFLFQSWASAILYIISLVSGLVSAFYFQVPCWMPYLPWGLNHWDLHHCNPLESTHGRYMCSLVMIIGPHQVCI